MMEVNSAGEGTIFKVQRFSIHDGPGIRTTVFLKGCPLRCGWCCNPESMLATPEIFVRTVKCIKCGECEKVCSRGAITIGDKGVVVDRSKCDFCLRCACACPSKAIERTGAQMSLNEVLGIVLRDEGYYKQSGGGLTLSGGEPLVQWHFAASLLNRAHEAGLHTAVETTGYAEWASLARVIRGTDLVLFDVKHADPDAHLRGTGVSNRMILQNLRKLLSESAGVRVWIRVPVIPSFNASLVAMRRIRSLIGELPHLPEKISLLPFHKFASGKYRALGRTYAYEDTALVSDEDMESYRETLGSLGMEVTIGF
jgi:pyruvate formate lyase activating enzyme